MEIKYLNDEEKIITRPLYAEVFNEDADELIAYYYERLAGRNEIVACLDGDTVVGMLHLCPKTLIIDGAATEAKYIYAVAVREEYRRRGVMERMLKFSFKDMEKQGTALVYLLTENENIYKKFGFRTEPKEEKINEYVCGSADMSAEEIERRMAYANNFLAGNYAVYEQHDRQYYIDATERIRADGGAPDTDIPTLMVKISDAGLQQKIAEITYEKKFYIDRLM